MIAWIIAAAAIGVVVAWLATVPLYRVKEMRPKTPRNVADEAGEDISAVMRHAVCPACHRHHRAGDVVPVVSWLRGCPGCSRRMPALMLALQFGLPVAMALTAATFERPAAAVPYLWFTAVVAAVAVVDARVWLIPRWLPWVGSAVGAVLIVVCSLFLGATGQLPGALLGAAGAFALFYVMWFVSPGRLGFGDVRLALMIGLFLGWISPALAVWGLLLGSVTGVVLGLVSLLRTRAGHFAFGPALAFGALLAVWLHRALLP